MALIKCNECGREVSDKAAACPACGAPVLQPQSANNPPPLSAIPQQRSKANKSLLFVIIAAFAVIFLVMLINAFREDQNTNVASAAANANKPPFPALPETPKLTGQEISNFVDSYKSARTNLGLGFLPIDTEAAGELFRVYLTNHLDADRDTLNLIVSRKIQVGMTEDEVRLSWGKPEHINSTQLANATQDQWVYGDGQQYLYFDDGQLTSWQTLK